MRREPTTTAMQVRFGPSTIAALEEIEGTTEASSRNDAIKSAIHIAAAVLRASGSGATFRIERPGRRPADVLLPWSPVSEAKRSVKAPSGRTSGELASSEERSGGATLRGEATT